MLNEIKMKKSFWLLIVVVVFVVVFSVQNAEVVTIEFAVWKGDVSLAILMILTFLMGLIIGALYYAMSIKRKTKNNKQSDSTGDVAFESKESSTVDKASEEV